MICPRGRSRLPTSERHIILMKMTIYVGKHAFATAMIGTNCRAFAVQLTMTILDGCKFREGSLITSWTAPAAVHSPAGATVSARCQPASSCLARCVSVTWTGCSCVARRCSTYIDNNIMCSSNTHSSTLKPSTAAVIKWQFVRQSHIKRDTDPTLDKNDAISVHNYD